jgi:hypothetical protein
METGFSSEPLVMAFHLTDNGFVKVKLPLRLTN